MATDSLNDHVLAFGSTFLMMSIVLVGIVPSAEAVELTCDVEHTDLTSLVLDGVRFIVVNEGGNTEGRLPSGIQIACTIDEYYDLFPEPPAETTGGPVGIDESTLILTDPEYQAAVTSGDYLPINAPVLNLGVTGGGTSYYDFHTGEALPEYVCIPTDPCNPNDPMEDVEEIEEEAMEFIESFCDPSIQCVLQTLPPAPILDEVKAALEGQRIQSSGSPVWITVVIPGEQDPQRPQNHCNMRPLERMEKYFEKQFPYDMELQCIIDLGVTEAWTPSDLGASATNQDALLDHCIDYLYGIGAKKSGGGGWADDNNEAALCIVEQMYTNGVADQSENAAIITEHTTRRAPWATFAAAMHETLHVYGAEHYPVPNPQRDWRNFLCAFYHYHDADSRYHLHTNISIMNYCAAQWGIPLVDGDNRARVNSYL